MALAGAGCLLALPAPVPARRCRIVDRDAISSLLGTDEATPIRVLSEHVKTGEISVGT